MYILSLTLYMKFVFYAPVTFPFYPSKLDRSFMSLSKGLFHYELSCVLSIYSLLIHSSSPFSSSPTSLSFTCPGCRLPSTLLVSSTYFRWLRSHLFLKRKVDPFSPVSPGLPDVPVWSSGNVRCNPKQK